MSGADQVWWGRRALHVPLLSTFLGGERVEGASEVWPELQVVGSGHPDVGNPHPRSVNAAAGVQERPLGLRL